jgi:hypothetical protein
MLKFFFSKKINQKKINKYPTNNEYAYEYVAKPKVSFIFNHFVALNTLLMSIKNLKKMKITNEIIVINDKGINTDKIFSSLKKNNDTVITTYNLMEVNGYILGSKISRATDFLVFIQDDDLAPNNNLWLTDVLRYFKRDKSLGLIGINGGGIKSYKKELLDFSKKNLNKNFFYCSWVKSGPLIFKKKVFDKIGGWEKLANIGEADHFSDKLISHKVWLNGYKTGLLINKNTLQWKRRFNRDDNLTKKDLKKLKNRNITWHLNRKNFLKKFKKSLLMVEKKAIDANLKIAINYK